MRDLRETIAQLRGMLDGATPTPWAWKSVGEKCYASILGSDPFYLSGPIVRKARRDDPPDPEIRANGSVSDQFDERANDFNEIAFTDFIAESDQQRAGLDFALICVAINALPALLEAAERGLHEKPNA